MGAPIAERRERVAGDRLEDLGIGRAQLLLPATRVRCRRLREERVILQRARLDVCMVGEHGRLELKAEEGSNPAELGLRLTNEASPRGRARLKRGFLRISRKDSPASRPSRTRWTYCPSGKTCWSRSRLCMYDGVLSP